MTASVWLEGASTARKILCLVDSGSDRTFIRKDLVSSEFVRVLNHEPVTINAFASQEQSTSQIMPVCELTVR